MIILIGYCIGVIVTFSALLVGCKKHYSEPTSGLLALDGGDIVWLSIFWFTSIPFFAVYFFLMI